MFILFIFIFLLFIAIGLLIAYGANKLFIAISKDDNDARRDNEIEEEYHRKMKKEIKEL